MAEPRPAELQAAPAPATNDNETPLVDAGRKADDPGGAHAKGYTADPPGDPAGHARRGQAGVPAGPGAQGRLSRNGTDGRGGTRTHTPLRGRGF